MSTTSGNRSLRAPGGGVARGAILALAAALTFATFGCQQATDSESDSDENVVSAGQRLDPVEGEDADDSDDGISLPGGDCQQGDENTDPTPQPWRGGATNGSSKPGPDPVDPSTKTSSVAPSGGHH